MTTERPELSVIIAAHQHLSELGRLLDALGQQTLASHRFEVIIVDDGSTPAIPRDLCDRLGTGADAPKVRLLRQHQAGPASARNTGIRQARGRILVFLNADAVPAPDNLERHLFAQARPRAILGRFDLLEAHETPFVALADDIGSLFPYDLIRPLEALSFAFFWTGNLSVPAEAVRTAGGFDESFRFPIFEDIELGRRLLARGLELHFDPAIRCGHDHPIALDAWRRRARMFGHEWVRFAKVHGGRTFPIIGGEDEPNALFARDVLRGLLNQQEAHEDRVSELERLLARAEAALGEGLPPATVHEALIRDGRELLIAIHTVERMEGITAALDGQLPAEREAWKQSLHPFALVHALVNPWDGPDTHKILQIMPRDATLIVTHTGWLGPEVLPSDPRLVKVRLDETPDLPASPWQHLLGKTSANAFVFLEGRPLPSSSEVEALIRFLAVSPRIGAVALGERDGRAHASAALTSRFPRHTVATTRAVLEGDRSGEGTFIDRLAARGLETALLLPAGSQSG